MFNTPNDQSRPGYLKMGWVVVGRPPVMALPSGVTGLARLRSARTAAELWSLPTSTGLDAAEALAPSTTEDLVAALDPPSTLSTNRTAAFLRWRHGLADLHYRAVTLGPDPGEGMALFRLRRRGGATEATLTELLVPAGPRAGAARRALVRRVARRSGADYVIMAADRRLLASPAAPLPGQGPILTWRAVTEQRAPGLDEWTLTMGDLELF